MLLQSVQEVKGDALLFADGTQSCCRPYVTMVVTAAGDHQVFFVAKAEQLPAQHGGMTGIIDLKPVKAHGQKLVDQGQGLSVIQGMTPGWANTATPPARLMILMASATGNFSLAA